MGLIPDPIHETKGRMVDGILRKMILDEDEIRSYTASIPQNERRIASVVENVNKQAAVEGAIGKRQMDSIKDLTGYRAFGPRKHFNALHIESGNRLAKEGAKFPIATADVKQPQSGLEHRREVLSEYCYSARVNRATMHRAHKAQSLIIIFEVAHNPDTPTPGIFAKDIIPKGLGVQCPVRI